MSKYGEATEPERRLLSTVRQRSRTSNTSCSIAHNFAQLQITEEPFTDHLFAVSFTLCDWFCSYSLTLVDAMDTLLVMGNHSEFLKVYDILRTSNFDVNANVSVFETNIRIVGGLLSSHLLSYKVPLIQLDSDWPCDGPLLKLAVDVATRLLPAFDTATGLPYGTVNLRHGVPRSETTVTCTASCGTFILEFGILSRLTGDPKFENIAMNAMTALWERRSQTGLVGNHIDVVSGAWVALEAGIGGSIDSYYEYLVKGGILFNKPSLLHQFQEYYWQISRLLRHNDWYIWAEMNTGKVTWPIFQSLEAFWPGLQTLIGDIDLAARTARNYHMVWQKFGVTPEFLHLATSKPVKNREGYPLRPELVESAMYLYRATRDKYWLELGRDIVDSIEYISKVKNVLTHELEDRMESFFLSETTKYLYLLFTPDHYLHKEVSEMTQDEFERLPVDPDLGCDLGVGGYLFNTEAHPFNVGVLGCCQLPTPWISEMSSSDGGKAERHIEVNANQRQSPHSDGGILTSESGDIYQETSSPSRHNEDELVSVAETVIGRLLGGVPIINLSVQDLLKLQQQIRTEIVTGLESADDMPPDTKRGVVVGGGGGDGPMSFSISLQSVTESKEGNAYELASHSSDAVQADSEGNFQTIVQIVKGHAGRKRLWTFGSGFLWLMSNLSERLSIEESPCSQLCCCEALAAHYGCVQRPYEERFAKLAVPLMDEVLVDGFDHPER